MQREQLEQLLSSNSILRSTFLVLYLREDNVEAFFTLLGTELYTFGPYTWAKMLDNKLCRMKLIVNGFHFNGNIIGVRTQTQKLEPPLKSTRICNSFKGVKR